jgi:sugar phosphate isomerase/epimerase
VPASLNFSVCLNSLSFDFAPALRQAADLGFERVDVIAMVERPAEDLEALAESGLLVAGAELQRRLPDDCSLDAAGVTPRREALGIMKRQIADAARLGATCCYLDPGRDSEAVALVRFAEACSLLADYAGQRMMPVCVRHQHSSALPTAAATLAWLEQDGHGNLKLLLDVGECLRGGEDPAAAVRRARSRLGHVRLERAGVINPPFPREPEPSSDGGLLAFLNALRQATYGGCVAVVQNQSGLTNQVAAS